MNTLKHATELTEEEARQELICPSCAREKAVGCIVCWDCFKGRTVNTPALKTYPGSFESWIKMLYNDHPDM